MLIFNKMKVKLISLFLVMTALFFLTGMGKGSELEAIKVLLPQNKAYVNSQFIHLVLVVNPLKVDRISFSINKKPPVAVEISKQEKRILTDGMIYQCTVVTLDPGDNKLTIYGYWQKNKIEEKNQQIYSLSKYSNDKNTPPSGYQHYNFHVPQNEGVCANCHTELKQADKETTILEESPCYKCHVSEFSGAAKHGPAADGNCAICHNSSEGKKYAIDEPDKKLCANCHEDIITAWDAKKYPHAPAAAGDCTICHSPHSSNNKFYLQKKTNELCIGCHEEQSSGKHIIASYVFGNSHPVMGKINPLKPEDSFSCVSCHSPHASNAEKLFAFETQGGTMSICQVCHKK